MSRFIHRDFSLLNDVDDDEEHLYEKKALIDDEICDDDIDLLSSNAFSIRQRQQLGDRRDKTDWSQNSGHELRNLNRNRDLISEPVIEYTYYDIQPNESLQSICLRFACSVTQVKRLNGLISDQEFYGLRRIKLPLGKLGLLEDILKSQQQGTSSDASTSSQNRNINFPGSALSVSTRHNPQFKPLLSPNYSSDRINEINKTSSSNQNGDVCVQLNSPNINMRAQHNHSHSFSSLRDFENNNVVINPAFQNNYLDTKHLKEVSFIKEAPDTSGQSYDLLMIDNQDNVGKVFEDLDYHVERAKVAMETYDQRASELVNRITINDVSPEPRFRTRVSKIPELFFCNENFGLNYKKLLVLIFVICLVVPLLYLNQSNHVVTTQL